MKLISCIRRFLNLSTTKTLVHAFVLSRINYCNSLLAGLPDKSIGHLQRVQNAAARLTLRKGRSTSSSLLLQELSWSHVNNGSLSRPPPLLSAADSIPLSHQNIFLLFSLPMCPRALLDHPIAPLSPSLAFAYPLMARDPSSFSHPHCSTPYFQPYQSCPTSPR